jgi:hypothetical protein
VTSTVLAFTSNLAAAEALVDELCDAGFDGRAISVLFPDSHTVRTTEFDTSSKAPEGTVAGVGAGGMLGGAMGWLSGIGALAIPGLGPFIAAGPIMAALSGAAVGAAVGGVTGGLIGLGIPELEARRYETKLKEGKILVSVATHSNAERETARRVFAAAGADDASYVDDRHTAAIV